MSGLRRSATISALWAAVEAASVSLLSFAVLLVLARILSPAEFGTAALALSLVQIGAVLAEYLFHDAIVQQPDLTDRQADAANVITIVVGCGLSALLMFGAPALERLFAMDGLGFVLFWMAPSIAFTALGAVPVALMRRELDFRSVALRMMIGRLIGGGVAIVAAFSGAGLWSIVLQQLATTAFASLAVMFFALPGGRKLAILASPVAAGALLRFGATSLAVNLLWGNISKIFVVACGFVLSEAGVGIVSLAMRLVDTLAAIISGAQTKVTLSLFSRIHGESGGVRKAYLAGSRLASAMSIPVFAGLAVVAHEVVLAFAGAPWLAAVPLVQMFGAAQVFKSLTLGGVVLTAVGRPSGNLVISLVELVVAVILLIFVGPLGVFWVGLAWLLRLLASMPVMAYLLHRHAGVGPGDLVVGTYRALLASLAMVVAVLVFLRFAAPPEVWPRLLSATVLGAFVYAAAIWLLDRQLYSIPRQLIGGRT